MLLGAEGGSREHSVGRDAVQPVVFGGFARSDDRRRLWRGLSASQRGWLCVRWRWGALVAW